MDKQQKPMVEVPAEPGLNPAPMPSQPDSPISDLKPDEWFKSDKIAEPAPKKLKLPSKRIVIIVIALTAVFTISGIGLLVANRNTSKKPATTDEPVSTVVDTDFIASEPETTPTETAPTPSVPTPTTTNKTSNTPASGGATTPVPTNKTYEIGYTSNDCFSPSNRTINTGDSIIFRNNNTNNKSMWPASNQHPVHNEYPGFDAGADVPTGGTFIFKFTKSGSWGYHDHIKPSCDGTITVL